MTQKAPAAPTAPKKQAPVQAPVQTLEVATPSTRFWAYIRTLQFEIFDMDFGAKKGKGGSELKDSHALHHWFREKLHASGYNYDITPIDVQLTPVVGQDGATSGFVVHGNYEVKFFDDGEIVYETKVFGAFDQGNSAQATHGSMTAANTSMMFKILQASVKSAEDMDKDRQNAQNRQAPRAAASTFTNAPY